jgi:hypothetical protein
MFGVYQLAGLFLSGLAALTLLLLWLGRSGPMAISPVRVWGRLSARGGSVRTVGNFLDYPIDIG